MVRKEILRYFVCFIKPKPNIPRAILADSILIMVFLSLVFVPVPARAGFFSDIASLLGANASADSITSISGSSTEDNSQTMPLLEANVSASLVKDKNTKKEGEESVVDETKEVQIIDNALIPTANPLGTSEEEINADTFSDQVSIYVVRKNDSITAIAKMFGVTTNTILWANDLKKGSPLKEGDTLVILPFDGVTHTVKAKETLAGIAKSYKADVDDILAFNGLTKEDKLKVGDELIIPDGQRSEEGDKPVPPKKTNSNIASGQTKSNLKSVDGYFAFPLPSGPRIRQTQGIHDRYAKDYGAPAGTPIYAAASGTVVVARNGYNGGYGNFVIMQHPNGTETRYAHMSKLGTTPGKSVSQGEVIGYVGTTGRSTGNHLHFEVRGARFPF